MSKIKDGLWIFNHSAFSSKNIEWNINLINYTMANFKGITPIRKHNPQFKTAILFFKAGGWSSCFVKLLISCKEYWILSNQNTRQDVSTTHTSLVKKREREKWRRIFPLGTMADMAGRAFGLDGNCYANLMAKWNYKWTCNCN